MRFLMVKRLMEILPQDGYNSMRWSRTAHFFEFLNDNDFKETKAFRKSLSTYKIEPADLHCLQNQELLDFFEHAVRRFNMQM